MVCKVVPCVALLLLVLGLIGWKHRAAPCDKNLFITMREWSLSNDLRLLSNWCPNQIRIFSIIRGIEWCSSFLIRPVQKNLLRDDWEALSEKPSELHHMVALCDKNLHHD